MHILFYREELEEIRLRTYLTHSSSPNKAAAARVGDENLEEAMMQ